MVTHEVHWSSLNEAVDMICSGPFHFSHNADYIYDLCPLPDPDVGLSIIVCDVEHTQGSTLAVFRHPEHPRFSDGIPDSPEQ